jgi:hypothetical protein
MTTSTVVGAAIAAMAAVGGALLGAYSTRSVELLRSRASLVEKAEERRLESLERFLLAVNAWIDWLIYMEDQGWEGQFDELNIRVKARDEAFRRLQLLASDDLYTWLNTAYIPLEYELKRTYAYQVRRGRRPDEQGLAIRRQFTLLLREELVGRLRPEVASLRNPIDADASGKPRKAYNFRRSIGRKKQL